MSLPKASLGNSASFQISGTPYVHETSTAGTSTITFKYVIGAITVQTIGGTATIHFGDSVTTNTFPLIAGVTYRFEIKSKLIKVVAGSGAKVSLVAEVTNVEAGQLAQHVQANYATVS